MPRSRLRGSAPLAQFVTVRPPVRELETVQAVLEALAADSGESAGFSEHVAATTDVHGIPDTATLDTATDRDAAIAAHADDTTSVHGIADTSALDTIAARVAAIDALKAGVAAGGDTLFELNARLAVVEALGSLATDAELIAAVAGILGTADSAGDTLGELQALIGLRMLKSANLSDLANAGTALTNLGVSTFIKTLLDDADAATARATLGITAETWAVFRGMPTGALLRSYGFDSSVEGWTASAGSVAAVAGELRFIGAGTALEPVGAANVADGEVELTFRAPPTGSVAVGFRMTDASNGYLCVLQAGFAPELYKYVGAGLTKIRGGLGALILEGGPWKFLIRFNGPVLEWYVNGTLILSHNDATYSTGRIGMWSDTASTMFADDIKVYTGVDLVTGNVRVR